METNILGLPSLTGYTPLKALQERQALKYDFREIGPIVVDKSGHGNLGRLKPATDPPRREVQSLLPLKISMKFDGKNDKIVVKPTESLKNALSNVPVSIGLRFILRNQVDNWDNYLLWETENYAERTTTVRVEKPDDHRGIYTRWIAEKRANAIQELDGGFWARQSDMGANVGEETGYVGIYDGRVIREHVNGELVLRKEWEANLAPMTGNLVIDGSEHKWSALKVVIFNRALSKKEANEFSG